nr:hypothetical protein [Tanacetum cinerariifolium]
SDQIHHQNNQHHSLPSMIITIILRSTKQVGRRFVEQFINSQGHFLVFSISSISTAESHSKSGMTQS